MVAAASANADSTSETDNDEEEDGADDSDDDEVLLKYLEHYTAAGVEPMKVPLLVLSNNVPNLATTRPLKTVASAKTVSAAAQRRGSRRKRGKGKHGGSSKRGSHQAPKPLDPQPAPQPCPVAVNPCYQVVTNGQPKVLERQKLVHDSHTRRELVYVFV
eukprot:jgi/Botrbrau1/2259/Bobra.101_2s0083.1